MLVFKFTVLYCWFLERECCQVKEFSAPTSGKVLKGHVIKTVFVPKEEMCRVHCFMNEVCQSINVRPPDLNSGQWRCELNDASSTEHLVDAKGHKYYATKNPCGSSPCVKNATCRPTFFDDSSFQCICPAGFTGEMCDEDVDECANGMHNCTSDNSCVNTRGSFSCSPKPVAVRCTGNGVILQPITRHKGYHQSQPACSCADVLTNTPGSRSGAYYLSTEEGGVALTYCHMDDIPGCGGGGWTLVMKIDGAKTTFQYEADLWSSKTSHSQASGQWGFDRNETKMPSYWSNAFTKLCLGMQDTNGNTQWLSITQQAVSLHALLTNNSHTTTKIDKAKWKSLLNGSSLQPNCNMQGFNVLSPSGTEDPAITRIGIISNNEEDCHSCNSRIGFGSAGTRGGQDGSNSCGNELHSVKHIKANCYILVQ